MIQRLAAIAAAVALVAAAFVVREAVIEKDDGDDGGDGPRVTNVVCASELGAACVEGATREDVNETFAAVVNDTVPSVWVTAGPWPEMADAARAATGGVDVFDRSEAVAASDLVAVVRRRPPQCPTEVTWKCLGDAAQASDARVAAPPRRDGTRLLIHAALLGGYLGRTDYATNDLRDDAAAAGWLSSAVDGIERGRMFGATSLEAFLVQSGSADVFITTGVDANETPGGEVVVPEPVARVDVVAGIRHPGPLGLEEFGAALRAAGWAAPASGDTGLPSPGVLLALREVGS